MNKCKKLCLLTGILLFLFLNRSRSMPADVIQTEYNSYIITYELTLPGLPVSIYDAISGDISGWWDHSFSESPRHFYIDAQPGGGFYEIFNETGNGVLHATVIAADRGKLLRFDGPLGLSGRAVKAVHTYKFSAVGTDSTRLNLSVHISGEIDSNLIKTVDRVWYHFLFERFKPFVLKGMHVLLPFEKNQKWGYKNGAGKVVIEAKYNIANSFNRYSIASVLDDQGWVYINSNGRYLLKPFIIDNGPDYFSEGLARFVSEGKIGFMDEAAAIIIPAKFDFVNPFTEGLASFCAGCSIVSNGEYHRVEGGKWGYINKTGKIVIHPEYDNADSFRDGRAEVLLGEKKIILNKKDIIE